MWEYFRTGLSTGLKHQNLLCIGLACLTMLVVVNLELDPDNEKVSRAASVVAMMAVLWVTTPIPAPVTALLPLVLFPVLGVMDGRDVSRNYFTNTHFVFVGSFFLADAVERAQLHKRIAINLLLVLGVKPFWLLIGFCLASFLLSTCLSNTATAIMLIPLTAQVVSRMEEQQHEKEQKGDEAELSELKGKEVNVTGANFGDTENTTEDRVGENHKLLDKKVNSAREGGDRRKLEEHQLEEISLNGAENDRAARPWETQNRMEKTEHYQDSIKDLPPSYCCPTKTESLALRKALALGVAYSANVGGTVTLTGTLPNLVYAGQLPVIFEKAPTVTFSGWFMFAAPFGCVMWVVTVVVLSLRFCPPWQRFDSSQSAGQFQLLRLERDALGPLKYPEYAVLGHGVVLVLLWFTRTIAGGGWSILAPNPAYVTDGTAAIAVSLSMFMFPAAPFWTKEYCAPNAYEKDSGPKKPKRLLDETAIGNLPWDVVILLGGGFALAEGSKISGLAAWLATCLMSLNGMDSVLVLYITVLLSAFITEFNSNLAATSMLLPVVAELSVALKVHPLAHMIATTLACSFAFMLPIATPPNAIAFSTKVLSTLDMITTGVWISCCACLLLTLYTASMFEANYGEDPFTCPTWACSNE